MTKKMNLYCVIFCFLMLTTSTPAFAQQSWDISAYSMGHADTETSIRCNGNNNPCFLTLNLTREINTAPQDYIDIAMTFSSGKARVQFMRNRSYLALNNAGDNVLDIALDAKGNRHGYVTLYDPEILREDSPDGLRERLVVRKLPVVAKLAINVKTSN